MDQLVDYEYWIDKDKCTVEGNFVLFRNEILKGKDGSLVYRYSPGQNTSESETIYIGDTLPVAKGVTAFFVGGAGTSKGIYSLLKNDIYFDSDDYYGKYFNIVSRKTFLENNRSPIKKSRDEVTKLFIEDHIKKEKILLSESDEFYSVSINNESKLIKDKIYDFANGYIYWVQKKYDSLFINKETSEPNSKLLSSPILQTSNIKPLLKADELSPRQFITAIEQLLAFIYRCFHDQSFPDRRPGLIYLTKALSKTNLGFIYLVHIDKKFLNFSYFKEIIRGMILDPNIDTAGLKIILSDCYESSKTNTDLYSAYLKTKKFEQYSSVFIEFEITTYQITYAIDTEMHKFSEHYSNDNFDYFSSQIYSYLKKEIFNNELVNAQPTSAWDDSTTSNFEQSPFTPTTPISPSIVANKLILPSVLDQYNAFEYKQVVENLLNFIMFRFKSQVSIIQYHKDRENCNTEIKIIENQYLIDIHPDMLEFNYFKQRFSEMYASIKYKKEALQNLFNNTYQQARNIYQYYRENIYNVHFDKKETICLRYDQFEGTITFDVQSPSSTLYTNNCLATFCQNIYTTIHAALYNNETWLSKDNHNYISTNNKQPVLDIESFLKTTLEPLTKQEYQKGKHKKLVFCIDNSFKNHLIGCFLALHKKEDLPICNSKYNIKTNIPFYDAIITIQDKLNIQTKDLITIITESLYKDNDDLKRGFPRTVRNELSNARRRIK